mmetsp:Transcript_121233/g.348301  ORF Transcript_121233/g.348301 Transcript_121233/m.348301 type:complete len:245 (-) Transcript_121233:931-1665(-)
MQERLGGALEHEGEPEVRGGVPRGLLCGREQPPVLGTRKSLGLRLVADRGPGRMRRCQLWRAPVPRPCNGSEVRHQVPEQRDIRVRHRFFSQRNCPGAEAAAGAVFAFRRLRPGEALPADRLRPVPCEQEFRCPRVGEPCLPRHVHLRLQAGLHARRPRRRQDDIRHRVPVHRRVRGAQDLQACGLRKRAGGAERQARAELGRDKARGVWRQGPLRVRQGLHARRLPGWRDDLRCRLHGQREVR